MTLMDRVSALLARKSSRAGAAVAAIGLPPARWTPRRYEALAAEGYRRNVVAYRCIGEVARACASVPWLLYQGARDVEPRGFGTVGQLNQYLDDTIGKTPPGYERHHIIPQHQTRPEYQTKEFKREYVHHTENIVIIPVVRHWMITHMDMNTQKNGGPLLRDLVAQVHWRDQRQIGLHLLRHRGVLADGHFR